MKRIASRTGRAAVLAAVAAGLTLGLAAPASARPIDLNSRQCSAWDSVLADASQNIWDAYGTPRYHQAVLDFDVAYDAAMAAGYGSCP